MAPSKEYRVPGYFDEQHVLRPHATPYQSAKNGPANPINPMSANIAKAPVLYPFTDPTNFIDPAGLEQIYMTRPPSPKKYYAEAFMCCADVEPFAGPASPEPALNSCFECLQAGLAAEVTTSADPICYIEYWKFQRRSVNETYQTWSIRYLYPVSNSNHTNNQNNINNDVENPYAVWKELVHPTETFTKLFLTPFITVKDLEGWINCEEAHRDLVSYKLN